MIYPIILFGVVIVIALAFIVSVGKWINADMAGLHYFFSGKSRTPFIVEQRYSAVDLQAVITYTDLIELQNCGINRPFDYFSREQIIRDGGHKQYLIEQQCQVLTKKMLEGGLIEILEPELDYGPPYRKQIVMKVKVYKKEAI